MNCELFHSLRRLSSFYFFEFLALCFGTPEEDVVLVEGTDIVEPREGRQAVLLGRRLG